jgi:hypothetical protein
MVLEAAVNGQVHAIRFALDGNRRVYLESNRERLTLQQHWRQLMDLLNVRTPLRARKDFNSELLHRWAKVAAIEGHLAPRAPTSCLAFRRCPTAAFRRPVKCRIDCYLPTKSAANVSESAGVLGAKNNLIFWLKRNNEILTIAPESNLPSVLPKTLSVPARKAAQSHPFEVR